MKETWFVFDVESSGPHPPVYSMLSIGVVKVTRELDITYYGEMSALFESKFDPEAMAVNGLDWEKHNSDKMLYRLPDMVMYDLSHWVASNTEPDTRAVAVSDNPAFDWQWLNFYMHSFTGNNPFGWSARRIGDMWHGLTSHANMIYAGQAATYNNQNSNANMIPSKITKHWHELRQTEHTHNALDDAKANASALIQMHDLYGLEVPCL